MSIEQIKFFSKEKDDDFEIRATKKANAATVSNKLLGAFEVADIPFFGCDFDRVYPELKENIPQEKITFNYSDINTTIACETICSAICHQINWDYLRQTVYKKTLERPDWLEPKSLAVISESEVAELLADYDKPERIRAKERATILRQIGCLTKKYGSFSALLGYNGKRVSATLISNNLLESPVFSQDPEEKKLQLLLQKLSMYPQFKELDKYCKPAIDYHLIRCFLRRGLISPITKQGMDYILSKNVFRRESTVGALRQLCGVLIQEISNYTGLSINSVNQIEWHVGRSICKEGEPDCYLKGQSSAWAREKYSKCPFHTTCCALNSNHDLLHIEEPTYLGTSY